MNAILQAYSPEEQDVLNVFNRHVASFLAGDLDAVVDDFATQAVVVTPAGVYEAQERIRALHRELLDEFGVIASGDSPGFAVDVLQVRHDTLFITWHARVAKSNLQLRQRHVCMQG